MKVLNLYSKAIKEVTGGTKMNITFHENTLPHLHAHLYPRYKDDPFPNQPTDYHDKKEWYSEDEFSDFISKLRATLVKLQED